MADPIFIGPQKRSPYSKMLVDSLVNAQAPTTNPGIVGGLAHVFAKGTGSYLEGKHANEEELRRQALSKALSSGDMTQVRAALSDIDPAAGAQSMIQDQRAKDENSRADAREQRQHQWQVDAAAQQNQWATQRDDRQRGYTLADRVDQRAYDEKKAATEQQYRLEQIDAQGKNKLAAISARGAAGSKKFVKFTDQNGMTKFQDSSTGDIYEDGLDGTLKLVASRQPMQQQSTPMSDADVMTPANTGDAGGAAPQQPAAGGAQAPKRNVNMTVSPDGGRGMFASGVMVNLKRPDGSDIPDDVFQFAPDVATGNIKARDASVNNAIKTSDKRRTALEDAATSANEEMALVDQFQAAARGAPYGARATLTSMANVPYQAVTGDSLPGASQIDAVNNLQLYFMKEARKGFPGAVSNYENQLYKAASPNIDHSPMGTYLMAEFVKSKASRSLQRQKLAEEYLADKTSAGLTPVLDAGFQKRLDAADTETKLSPEAENILKLLGEGKHTEAQKAFRALNAAPAADSAAPAAAQGAAAAAAAAPTEQNAPAAAVELSSAPPDVQDALKAGKTVEGPDGKKYKLSAQGTLEEVK